MAKVSYTTATLSAEVDTTPKELRKFLRSPLSGIESVGKGGRYTIELTATQLAATKKKFAKWIAEGEAKREAAKVAAQGPSEADEVAALAMIDGTDLDTTEWPDEAREAYEDEAPTDADLDAIDLEDEA